MDSNQENDVRQQRLSLTWSGTNEGGSYEGAAGEAKPEEPHKPKSRGLKILKRPATVQTEGPAPAEEETVSNPVEELRAELPEEMFADAAEELAELQEPAPETPEEDETVVVKAPEPVDDIPPEELETVVAQTPDMVAISMSNHNFIDSLGSKSHCGKVVDQEAAVLCG